MIKKSTIEKLFNYKNMKQMLVEENITTEDLVLKYGSEIEAIIEYLYERNISVFHTNKHLPIMINFFKYSVYPIYDRFVELDKLSTRDSSSLRICELRYGDKGRQIYNEKNKKSVSNGVEYYQNKHGVSVSEATELNFQRNKNAGVIPSNDCLFGKGSLEEYKRILGDVEGERRFKTRCDKISKQHSKEYFYRKHGEKWNTKYATMKDNRSKGYKNNTKENIIKRLKNDGYSDTQIEDKLLYRWDHTSEASFISRYGKKLGITKHKEYLDKLHNSPNVGYASRSSIKFFIKLYKMSRRAGIHRNDLMFMVKGSNELSLKKLDSNYRYRYDFTCEASKIIIEFNGSHIHPNPNISKSYWNSWFHVFDNRSADEVWIEEENKRIVAEHHGYKLFSVYDNMDLEEQLYNMFEEIIKRVNINESI